MEGDFLAKAKEIDSEDQSTVRFSICTIVNDREEYAAMIASFYEAGFTDANSEFLYVDNSVVNKYDAFQAINKFIAQAKGTYLILCHQDILLNFDTIEKLDQCIEQIWQLDKKWAVLGNAGGIALKRFAKYFVNGRGEFEHIGKLPCRVQSVDENFMVIRKDANLTLSADLEGFHFYALDLCTMASILGYHTYVVDFKLTHKSFGHTNHTFWNAQKRFIAKYGKALPSRFIQTTCTRFYLSASPAQNKIFNSRLILFFARQYYKIKHKLER